MPPWPSPLIPSEWSPTYFPRLVVVVLVSVVRGGGGVPRKNTTWVPRGQWVGSAPRAGRAKKRQKETLSRSILFATNASSRAVRGTTHSEWGGPLALWAERELPSLTENEERERYGSRLAQGTPLRIMWSRSTEVFLKNKGVFYPGTGDSRIRVCLAPEPGTSQETRLIQRWLVGECRRQKYPRSTLSSRGYCTWPQKVFIAEEMSLKP